MKEATHRASVNDSAISESDNESDKSGLELVIPAHSSSWPPSPGQSASRPSGPHLQADLNPLIAPPVVPQGAQPFTASQQPARPTTPTP